MTHTYAEFIAGKQARPKPAGFDWPADRLPAAMFDWQKRGCLLALKRGRCALFLNTGLGKTLVQLAWASAVAEHAGRPVLLLCPLAVGPQTVREADKFGIAGVSLFDPAKGIDPPARVVVTNYQKLHLIDPTAFSGVVLDESSILKSFTGATKRQLCEAFAATPYRLACTATPSPNDHMELGNHSQFLGVMDSTEMLTRWFINDPSQAGVYRIKGHAEADFWAWVCSWAVFAAVPSDLGGDDSTHALPPLELVRHEVAEDQAGADGQLFRSDAVTATTIHRQKRETIAERAAEVAEVVAADPGRPWLVWCDTDYEADALLAAVPGSVDVRGSQSDAVKEDRLAGFAGGRYPTLIGKPSQLGFGLNWQHCCRMAFAGLSFSFEQYYQAVRRCWRFGQTQAVQVHVVCSPSEWQIVSTVERKQADFEAMQAGMRAAARSAFADDTGGCIALADATSGEVRAGKRWELVNDDCVKAVGRLAEKSVGFSIHSPPFSNLYIYSDSQFDMGNSADHAEFFEHYGYLVPALLRATIPGRLAAVHCKDLPLYMNRDGVAGLYPFPDEITRLFISHGWTFHSRVTIWKCPVTEMERTKNHGLLHKTVKADSSAVRQGMADYLLVFRRPPTEGLLSDSPVSRPTGLTEWHGDPELDPRTTDVHPSKYSRRGKRSKGDDETNDSIRIWQRMADPVWWHIDQTDVLNKELAREDRDEKHICPLQLGVIREAVGLWTLPGDLVIDPFTGIGSAGVVAIDMGRRYWGSELKPSYFDVACQNLIRAERRANVPTLLDLLPENDEPSPGAVETTAVDPEPAVSPSPGETAVNEVYADGGVVGRNPSTVGGTWAWCHVTAAGERAAEASGFIEPADAGTPEVSNNQTEFLALLLALEALPDGWSGKVFTDSGVTLQRFQNPERVKQKGINPEWVGRLKAVRNRLGVLEWVLLGGHPTRADLKAGTRASDGKPVSKFNQWCDKACGAEAERVKARPQPA